MVYEISKPARRTPPRSPQRGRRNPSPSKSIPRRHSLSTENEEEVVLQRSLEGMGDLVPECHVDIQEIEEKAAGESVFDSESDSGLSSMKEKDKYGDDGRQFLEERVESMPLQTVSRSTKITKDDDSDDMTCDTFTSDYVVATRRRRRWDPDLMLEQTREFDAHFASMEKKMHRFPRRLYRFREEYCAQLTVPIGPHMEFIANWKVTMAKNAATHHFTSDLISDSDDTMFRSFGEMYEHFSAAVGDVRSFYGRSDPVVAPTDTNDDSLKLSMLRDGCFLLQYMLMFTIGNDGMPASLVCYYDSNQAAINHDMVLLENQLPWVVIQTLRSYKEVNVEKFIAKLAHTLQVRKGIDDDKPFLLNGYEPPHLLGLLRFYKIGSEIGKKTERFSLTNYCCYRKREVPPSDGIRPLSRTVSAMELAEIGIKVKANKTTKLMDMGIKKGFFGGEIFLASVLLDETRLCWLLNMAAFEQLLAATCCSHTDEKHAVCCYLVVLSMLMDREEDVHSLRSKGLVNGLLTNKEILDFFKGPVKHINGGPFLVNLMEEIEDYRLKRWMWIRVHKFFYRHYKTIAAVLSVVSVLVAIFKTLVSLKQH